MPVGSGLRLGAARGSGLRLGAPTASTMIGKSGQGITLSRHIQVSSPSLTCILEPMIGRSQVERVKESPCTLHLWLKLCTALCLEPPAAAERSDGPKAERNSKA